MKLVINSLYKNLVNIALMFLFIAVFLIKLPPLYIFSTPSRLFTTHVLAKIILMGIFIYLFLNIKTRKKITKNNAMRVLLIYFISQSISIISANDVILFLKDYQNLISSLVLFVTAFVLLQTQRYKRILFGFIVSTGIFIVGLDFIFYLFPNQTLSIVNELIQKEVLEYYTYNLQRGRYNLYLNTELFLPFFITAFLFFTKDKLSKTSLSLTIFLTIFLTFVSNFRHRLLFLLFVLISYGIFLWVKRAIKLKQITIIFFLFVLTSIISSLLFVRTFYERSIINRVFLEDETEDINSLRWRANNLRRSIDLAISSPFFGIGLGNYQKYAEDMSKFKIKYRARGKFFLETPTDPHNIISKTISETGIVGFMGLIIMIIFFLSRDILLLKRNTAAYIVPYIISFWGLFILSLITPSITIFRGGWMWFLRGIIESIHM